MTDHTPTNPTDRVAAALERIAAALERAHPDPALDAGRHRERQLAEKDAATAAMRAMVDAVISPNIDPDGEWIEWHGGECPVAPSTLVNVRLRDGTLSDAKRKASAYTWAHTFSNSGPFNIIAYRLAK
jgi:hypothetical protein